MRMIKGAVVLAILAMPLVGRAEDAPVTNVTWKSSVALGATYKSGNTDKTLYTLDFKANRYAPKSDWINNLHGEYGTTEGEQTEGQLREQSDYRYKFGGKNWYGGVFSEAYHDALKDINYRIKIGPNVGYYFINKEAVKLDGSFGINYVHETNADGSDDHAEWRIAGNYLQVLSKTASLYANAEYSCSFDDSKDGTGLLVVGAKSKVNERLSMFIEAREEYDNLPVDDLERTDTTIIAGLSYDLL